MKGFACEKRLVLLVIIQISLSASTARAADEPQAAATGVTNPVSILVAYDSLRGNTELMAKAVAEGASGVPAAVVTVKRVDEVTKEDLVKADGIILGCPTYYANISGGMKVIIDDWSWKMKVDFTDKVGGAFSTGGGQTGGKEHVVVSLLLYMLNNRMVVAGPLYQDAEGDDKWAEVGATAATGPTDPGVAGEDLDGARRVGERIARLASKMKAQ